MKNMHKRYGNTAKKMITITHEGREQLQQFADAHNMSFSATIETLALIGMKADLSVVLIPLLHEAVQAGLQRHFNRLAKVGVIAAAEASMTHDLTTMLLLQTIRAEAARYPQDFENRIPVSYDPNDTLDFRIREIYNQMRQLARKRQQRLLRQPLAELLAEYAPESESDKGEENE